MQDNGDFASFYWMGFVWKVKRHGNVLLSSISTKWRVQTRQQKWKRSTVPHWSCLLTPFLSFFNTKACMHLQCMGLVTCTRHEARRCYCAKLLGHLPIAKAESFIKTWSHNQGNSSSSTKPREGRKERLIPATMEALAEPQTQSSYFFYNWNLILVHPICSITSFRLKSNYSF